MDAPRIRVKNLGKRYRIGRREGYKTLRDSIARSFQNARNRKPADQYIWALRGISIDVWEGEKLGIIGRNGAGKSTLLRILSRITEPTEGSFEIRGRVGSLLEIGTGFHPELTGRENIFLSGAILGMKKREIDRRFDEIVEFSELRKFIDTPIKYYSSGMWVRLGFAVSVHMEPEILLVDEVLAAGDASFQRKCLRKIGEVTSQGRTVLMVSHNLRAITDYCEKCLWIDQGRIVQIGTPEKVVVAYLESTQPQSADGTIEPQMHDFGYATRDVFFRQVAVVNRSGQHVSTLFFGEPLRIKIEFEACKAINDLHIAVAVEKRADGTLVVVLHNRDAPESSPLDVRPGVYSALMETELPLLPGVYSITLQARLDYWASGSRALTNVSRATDFTIEGSTRDGKVAPPTGGLLLPNSKWDFQRKDSV